MASCRNCARGVAQGKTHIPDKDNLFCVACKRNPTSRRPDNYITLDEYRNQALALLYGRQTP